MLVARLALGLVDRVAVALGRGDRYRCPACEYIGPLLTIRPETGVRKNAVCPRCRSGERHRLAWLVMSSFLDSLPAPPRVLHFAPEPLLQRLFRSRGASYASADLTAPGVDHHVDITDLPFEAGSFDLVFASHVLEHVRDDRRALAEIRRVLGPGGVAVLPVPTIGAATVEYDAPNPHEAHHVRCPGLDYFDRYRQVFARVEVVSSADVDPGIQPFVFEDRSRWPSTMALRPSVAGERHPEYVPLCFV